MLTHKHTETLDTLAQKQPLTYNGGNRGILIDISTVTVDLIFSAWWRGTAMENAANQPVSQSGYLLPARAPSSLCSGEQT